MRFAGPDWKRRARDRIEWEKICKRIMERSASDSRARASPNSVLPPQKEESLNPSLCDVHARVSPTPRSFRGTDPDDYDRVMEVTSMGPQETIRLGEGNAMESEVDQEGVAHNSDEFNEARGEPDLHRENADDDPGAGRSSRGFGVSLQECLDRLGQQLSPAIPATCASGANTAGNLSQSRPRHENYGLAVLIPSSSFGPMRTCNREAATLEWPRAYLAIGRTVIYRTVVFVALLHAPR